MPAFIKTPADEKRWSKAKEAANKTLSESDGDKYWALVNSIYQKMTKSDDMEVLEAILMKVRRRMSDEAPDDEEEPSLEEQGFREFDPEIEHDDAERWLQEHDPERGEGEPDEESSLYDEYGPDEDEESHQNESVAGEEPVDEVAAQAAPVGAAGGAEGGGTQEVPPQEAAKEEVKSEGRFPQPSKEEIAEMRQYTRPWEQRARDRIRLEAEPHKNPVLHHEGRLLEARNAAHKSRQDAYAQFQASPEYQNADPISQMEMDANFHKDWQEKNPDYFQNAVKLHEEAHKKGQAAKDIHAAHQHEKEEHIRQGGSQGVGMSQEEAMQHVGGAKDEEGMTTGSTVQDPAASFAAQNKDFLKQYFEQKDKKQKKPKSLEELGDYDQGSRQDVHRVLGEHPALKDPAKKAKMDAFFEKFHPLISMSAHKVLNKLGIDKSRGDIDLGMLHEAGMHGLMQAINDYDHEHPSKANFATHAGNKIRGLMQTAMRDKMQDVPSAMRTQAKKYNLQSTLAKHPPEVADRIKRIQTFRQVHQPKPKMPKPEGGGQE